MTQEPSGLTAIGIRAAATEALEANGYQRLPESLSMELTTLGGRLFEDPYGVVCLVVFETWAELKQSWPDAQDLFVEVLSKHISRGEAKAWDGYLVLATPSRPDIGSPEAVDVIRYDTTRVRKFVISGDELSTISDVDRGLSPLLPLKQDIELGDQESTLESLARILVSRGIPQGVATALVEGFTRQEPLLERIHKALS